MQSVTTLKAVNKLSPARRVPDMRNAAANTNVAANPVRPLYQRLNRPNSSRIRLAATSLTAKQTKSAPRALASGTLPKTPSPRVPKLHARARADYEQDERGYITKTRIPRPAITATKEANVRRRSGLWARMASVVVRQSTTARVAEQLEEKISVGEYLIGTCEKARMEFEEPPSGPNEPTNNELDNTSLMFNDNSFNEPVSANQQTTALNIFGRKMVSMKRLGLGLRTNRRWFVGLARCPDYTGDLTGIARVRPRAEKRVESDVVPSNGFNGSAVTAAPALAKANASTSAVVAKVPAKMISPKIVSETTKRQLNKTKAKPALFTGSTASFRKARNPAVPMTVSHNASSERRAAFNTTTNKSKSVLKSLPISNSKPIRYSTQKSSRSHRSKLTVKPNARPMTKGSPTLKSAIRRPNPKAVKKHVCFIEGPIQPRFYSAEDTVKQSAITVDGSSSSFYWEPLAGLVHSQPSCEGKGSTQLFEGTSSGTLTLKRRFLHRYASVQQYEACRRGEDLAQGERATLGQLEYGNADFKIAIRATNAITPHDIGMLQDLSAIGKACKMLGRSMTTLVLIFGLFKEPFENAAIPTKRIKPYKKPLRWPVTGSEGRLEEFAAQHLKCLQVADLDD